jgi:glutamate-1-semialdehyde 2,1-aminomutase
MDRSRSTALFETAQTLFPGGVSSPVRAFKSVYGPPLFIQRGSGPWIWDADDHRYLDFCASWGPLIHGHAHPDVLQAIAATAANGTSFGTPTRCENALGSLILNHHRYLERLRFVSSGTEAVMSALRLARGATGRNKIVKFEGCYHGHTDSLLVRAGSGLATMGVSTSAGIPEAFAAQTLVLDLDDEAAFERLVQEQGHDIAAVIIEPVPANNGLLLQRPEYLHFLRQTCNQHGILLIFDEVISGFRIGFEGAAGYYGIQPDLITMGKVIGGGLPVGAYGGRRDLMERVAPLGDVYQAGTLSGNPVAMAAGCAQLYRCLQPGFYQDQAARTERFCRNIENVILEKGWPVQVVRMGSIFWLAFADPEPIRRASHIRPESMEPFKRLHKALLERGVYLGPSGYEVAFVSSVHTEAILEEGAGILTEALGEVF